LTIWTRALATSGCGPLPFCRRSGRELTTTDRFHSLACSLSEAPADFVFVRLQNGRSRHAMLLYPGHVMLYRASRRGDVDLPALFQRLGNKNGTAPVVLNECNRA